ncbi:hypothetical protein D3C80_1769830 [compost metagenome]
MLQLLEDVGNARLAGVIGKDAEGNALGAQVFAQLVDPNDFAQLLRAGDGAIEGAPATDRGGQGEQQYDREAQGELQSYAQVA